MSTRSEHQTSPATICSGRHMQIVLEGERSCCFRLTAPVPRAGTPRRTKESLTTLPIDVAFRRMRSDSMATDLDGRTTGSKSGELFAFPLAARTGDIDRCARELDRVHGDAAVHYWKTECRKLAAQLSALGLADEEIRREIIGFQAEVQAAMAQRYRQPSVERNRSDSGA